MKLDLQSLVTDLCLSVLLLAVSWTAVNFWMDRVRQGERQKVVSELTAEWGTKLRTAESKAQSELLAQKDQHAKTLRAVNLRLAANIAELRKRPSRSDQNQAAAGNQPAEASACTGAGLAREDGEFLAGEAAAAAEQQAQLIEAEQGYETCRQALRSVTDGRKGDSDGNASNTGPPD